MVLNFSACKRNGGIKWVMKFRVMPFITENIRIDLSRGCDERVTSLMVKAFPEYQIPVKQLQDHRNSSTLLFSKSEHALRDRSPVFIPGTSWYQGIARVPNFGVIRQQAKVESRDRPLHGCLQPSRD